MDYTGCNGGNLPVHAQTSSTTTQPPGGTTTTTTTPPGGTTTTTTPPGGTTTTTTTTTAPPSCPPISFGPGTPNSQGCIETSNTGTVTLASGCGLSNTLDAEWQCQGNAPQSPNIANIVDNGDGTFSFDVTGPISFSPGDICDLVIFDNGMEIGRQCYLRL